jgi:hypothetical protein
MSLTLAWDAPTIYEDGTPITKLIRYNVYRRPTSGGEWAKLTTTILTHYTQMIVTWGRFTYKVTASVDGEESNPSNEDKINFEIRGEEEEFYACRL